MTRKLLALVALGGVLGAIGTGTARADAATDYAIDNAWRICFVLDVFPSFDGLEGIAVEITAETGRDIRFAGRAIRLAVDNVCPRHTSLLNRYARTYAPTAVV